MHLTSRHLIGAIAVSALVMVVMASIDAGVAAADAHRAAVSTHAMDWRGLRWWVVIIQIATIPIGAAMIGLSATLRDKATLERLFGIREKGVRPAGARIRDITSELISVRRHALIRAVVLTAVATAVAVLVWYIRTLLKAPPLIDVAMLPMALVVMTAAYLYLTGRRPDPRPFQRQPLVPALIGSAGALIVTFVVSFCVTTALGIVILTTAWYIHGFPRMSLVIFLGILLVAFVFLRFAPRMLRFTAVPLELAQRLVVSDVNETLNRDRRREVLLLRSFGDDQLMLRTHRSVRHSPIELVTAHPFERFEVLLTWALWQLGPVCAIGQPGKSRVLQPLGAAREYYGDDQWREAARLRMVSSTLIVFVLGQTLGLQWEIASAHKLGVLNKCLFVVPPVDTQDSSQRLAKLADILKLDRSSVPPVVERGRHVIGLYITASGQPTLVCADGKDDLAYQGLVEHVAVELAQGAGEPVERQPALHSARGAASVGEHLSSIILTAVDDYEKFIPRPQDGLTVRDGVRFIWSSLVRRIGLHRTSPDDAAAVRTARAQMYTLIQRGDWSAIYDQFLSPRSRASIPNAMWVQANRERSKGRDYSGPESVDVAVEGKEAIVRITPFDGSPGGPMRFVRHRGRWMADLTRD